MKIRKYFLYLSAIFALFLLFLVARRTYAQQAIEKRFNEFDTNGDGKLTADELPQASLFKALDLDGNGEITKLEAARAFLKGALKAPGKNLPGSSAVNETPTPDEPDKPFMAPVRQGPKLLIPGEHGIGDYVADLEFTDIAEERHSMSEFATKRAVEPHVSSSIWLRTQLWP